MAGWLVREDVGAAGGVLCGGLARTDTGAALLRLLGHWWGLYSALPCHGSALLVAATSAHYRAIMHGAAQAFGRARAIGAAKSVSLKKTDSVRFKIILKKGLKLKKNPRERERRRRKQGGS